jgi:amino acid permease
MDSLNFITMIYLGTLILLVIYIFILLLPYYNKFTREFPDTYETGHWIKEPTKSWPEGALVLFIGFYVQPFVFSLRNELAVPTLRRLKKATKLALSFELVIFALISFLGYYVFGDEFTTEVFII